MDKEVRYRINDIIKKTKINSIVLKLFEINESAIIKSSEIIQCGISNKNFLKAVNDEIIDKISINTMIRELVHVNTSLMIKNYKIIQSITSTTDCNETLSDDLLRKIDINSVIKKLEDNLNLHPK